AQGLAALDAALAVLDGEDREAIQNAVLDVGRGIPRYQDLKKKSPTGGPGVSFAWFSALYELLLGEKEGPRFGSFVAAYGIPETRALIARALAGELAAPAA
ncbi:MAG: lysine--tRNA ligase, partial [Azorhizobium sp. 35-67-5]